MSKRDRSVYGASANLVASEILPLTGGQCIQVGDSGGICLSDGSGGEVTLAAGASTTSYTLAFPSAIGAAGQSLLSDGVGGSSWGAGSNPFDQSLDTTDVPTFAGATMTGDLKLDNSATALQLENTTGTGNYVSIGAPAAVTDYTLTVPGVVPTATDQSLTATTAGVTSWAGPMLDKSVAAAIAGVQVIAGDVNYLGVAFAGGLPVLGGLYTQTADITVLGTATAQTTLIGSGEGFLTIPANVTSVGNTTHVKCGGILTTVGTSRTITVEFNLDGSVILSGTVNLANNLTNTYWGIDVLCAFRSIGVSGTVQCHGNISVEESKAFNIAGMVTTAPVTIDTTTASVINLTVAWTGGGASDSMTCQVCNMHTGF